MLNDEHSCRSNATASVANLLGLHEAAADYESGNGRSALWLASRNEVRPNVTIE